MADLQHSLIATMFVSLRLVPLLAFSPPFTLVRIPALVRLVLCLSLSAWLVAAHPAATEAAGSIVGFAMAASELTIGIALALCLQLAFAALMTVGRAIDLQAGYAFAMIADPSSRTQMPLIGMLFTYAAGAIFFATDGPANLLAILSLSLDHLPLGSVLQPDAPQLLAAYAGTVFVLAFGGGGLVLLVLFIIDSAIALSSRTLPQMNVLFFGFQVKALATLMLLPLALAGSASLFLQMSRFALDTMVRIA